MRRVTAAPRQIADELTRIGLLYSEKTRVPSGARIQLNGRPATVLPRGGRPDEVIAREIPESRIVDESIWFRVQELTTDRRRDVRAPGPAARYPLSGIGRCGSCGGSIDVARTTRGTDRRVPAYACTFHHSRGSTVCPVTIHQPMDDVHAALIDYLKRSVLTPSVLDTVVSAIRDEVAKLLSAGAKDVTGLEKELAGLRAEQKRLARAVATAGDDIPELVAELRLRNDRIRRLEADLAADTARRVWAISGTARLDSLKLSSDPSGIRTRRRTITET